MGPLCACGCGEHLPERSTRKYKRGHRDNPPDDIGNLEFEDSDMPLEELADTVENDPDPEPPESPPHAETPIRVTRSVRKDIEAKTAFMLLMPASVWQGADPVCGGVAVDCVPDTAAALAPIFCESQDVVRWFRRSGGFIKYVDLFKALLPLFQTVYAHHVARAEESPVGHVDAQAPQYAA